MRMKTMLLALLPMLALWSGSASAKDFENAISIEVFLPIMSPVSYLVFDEMAWIPLNIKYQRVVSDHLVLMLKGGLNYSWAGDEKILDVYPMMELDWHPFHTGLKGFYIGPSGFYNYSTYRNSTEGTDHYHRAALGGTIGWQFVLPSHMTIDLTFGLGYGYEVEGDVNGKRTSGFSLDETIGGIFLGSAF